MIKISEYLKEERIVLDLKVSNKEEGIKTLAKVFKGQKEVVDFDRFLADIFERENLGTTGIGLGLALPHSRTQAINSFVIAIGRVPKGLEFNSLDGEPVKLIFLMGTPKEEIQGYLKILAHLTRLLKREAFRTALVEAETSLEVIQIFKKEEEIPA